MPLKKIDRTKEEVFKFFSEYSEGNTTEIYLFIRKEVEKNKQTSSNASGSYNSFEVSRRSLSAILRKWCAKKGMKDGQNLWELKEEYK